MPGIGYFESADTIKEAMAIISDPIAIQIAQRCFLCSSCNPAKTEVIRGKFTHSTSVPVRNVKKCTFDPSDFAESIPFLVEIAKRPPL